MLLVLLLAFIIISYLFVYERDFIDPLVYQGDLSAIVIRVDYDETYGQILYVRVKGGDVFLVVADDRVVVHLKDRVRVASYKRRWTGLLELEMVAAVN